MPAAALHRRVTPAPGGGLWGRVAGLLAGEERRPCGGLPGRFPRGSGCGPGSLRVPGSSSVNGDDDGDDLGDSLVLCVYK